MLEHFLQFIEEEHLFPRGGQVLLAVSGGRDSMTMCDLMSRAGFSFAMAHCNFHLRPGDCDRDEAFVRRMAGRYGVGCHVVQFDTLAFARRNGLSVEEAARKLRYDFFERLCEEEGFSVVATAHHQDDAIETFFINLLRGTGIAGLHGIKVRNGRVVRPMLAFSRKEIDDYVHENGIEFVEDYTNAETFFLRNRIRHDVIPLLRDISPAFDSTMLANMSRLGDAEQVYRQVVEHDRQVLMSMDGEGKPERTIVISWLRGLVPQRTRLFELLRPFGFTSEVCNEILESLDGQSGKQFFSPTHRVVKDRERLILTRLDVADDNEYCLVPGTMEHPIRLLIEEGEYDGRAIKLGCDEAWFDLDKLRFPLRLRRWHKGDRFMPFGMRGSRLVSDLLNDKKLSLVEKERVWVITDGEGVLLWVVGLRASRTASVGPATKRLLKIHHLHMADVHNAVVPFAQ